ILLNLPSVETKNTVLSKLDQFIFSEDVQLGDVTDAFAQLAIVGPAAASVVGSLLAEDPKRLAALGEHGCFRGEIAGGAAIITRITDAGEPGFDVYVEAARSAALVGGLSAAGLTQLDAETADILRVEAGIPVFHRDMDEETIP